MTRADEESSRHSLEQIEAKENTVSEIDSGV
jgi:hypothetical protein